MLQIFLILFFLSPSLIMGQNDSTTEKKKVEVAKTKEEKKEPRKTRRRTKKADDKLTTTEKEFVDRHRENRKLSSRRRGLSAASRARASLKKSSITERMKLEVVDESLANVFRLVSKTYKINIVPEAGLENVKVTIHLEDIPVMEGLQVLCQANGLEIDEINGVVYVKKASDKAIAEMSLVKKKIDINVENKPIKEFIKEFAAKTGLSIVPGQSLEGKVTGHLKNVLPINGIKALLAANNYKLSQKAGIYVVVNAGEGATRSRSRTRTPTGGDTDIDVVNGKITATLVNSNLGDAIRSITEQADLDIIMYGDVTGTVNAKFKEIEINKALALLLKGTKYTFILKEGMILIGDRSSKHPSGAALSTVEVHPLKYIRADKKILNLFPKAIPADGIKIVEEQNAVLISGTAERISQIKEFLEKVDLPVPQVMLEVMIVEYDRSSTSQFGVDKGRGALDGPNVSGSFDMSGGRWTQTFGDFQGAIRFFPQNWALNLRSNLSKRRGKVLAMPKITTLNGNAAHLRVRSTEYYPVSSFNKEGLQTTDFRAIDDGITIDLTPWVTQHGDVNLEIKPSIKTAQPQADPNRPAAVTDRAITSNVRLRDGETLILGGLIDSKESYDRSFVPLLGQIPLLGYLFSWRSKVLSTTELVIYVTPHILMGDGHGVDMIEEFRKLDKRGGFIRDEDFISQEESEKASEVESVPVTEEKPVSNTGEKPKIETPKPEPKKNE